MAYVGVGAAELVLVCEYVEVVELWEADDEEDQVEVEVVLLWLVVVGSGVHVVLSTHVLVGAGGV